MHSIFSSIFIRDEKETCRGTEKGQEVIQLLQVCAGFYCTHSNSGQKKNPCVDCLSRGCADFKPFSKLCASFFNP